MKSIKLCYTEILGKIINKERNSAPKNTLAVELEPKNDINEYISSDISCSIKLLELGYPLNEVIATIKTKSPATKKLDATAKAIYIDRVISEINKEWQHHAESAYSEAEASYKRRASAILSKYKEYDKNNFGLFHDGSIALAMIKEDNFAPELVARVISKNTLNKSADESYFDKLNTAINGIMERYQRIFSYDTESAINNASSLYLKYAHERLKTCPNGLFSGQDEQKILETIHDKIFSDKNLAKNHDSIMERFFKPTVREAILENSPIILEPGRDKELYLKSVFEEFTANCKVRNKESVENYLLTEERFKNLATHESEELHDYIRTHDNAYIDAVVSKKLLEEHHSVDNIAKAITLNSKAEDKSDGYIKRILNSALDSLHAEREIVNFNLRELGSDINHNNRLELSVKELFRQMLKERIIAYPSFTFELTAPHADRDAVEKLLNRYPDCDRDELKKAIMEASPRAKLPSIGKDYADKVITIAETRINRVREIKEQKSEFEQEYNKLRGLATEGVQNDNPMNSLKDGKIAKKMLRQGINKDDIKDFLVTIAKGAAMLTPALYADKILAKASDSLEREHEVASYNGPSGEVTCENTYMAKMNRQYQNSGLIKTGMDIETVRELILEKHYNKTEIKDAVLSKSPTASEPGRDNDYADYALKMAEESIEREKAKLKHYVAIPRLEHSRDVKEEYEHHCKQMMRMVRLPFCLAMDVLIGQALLSQGFLAAEIAGAMDEKSPYLNLEQDQNIDHDYYTMASRENGMIENYGAKVLREVREITETITETRSEDQVLARTRTIEENVTKTIEDA